MRLAKWSDIMKTAAPNALARPKFQFEVTSSIAFAKLTLWVTQPPLGMGNPIPVCPFLLSATKQRTRAKRKDEQ